MQYGREFEAEEEYGEVIDLINLEDDDFAQMFSESNLSKEFAALVVPMVTEVGHQKQFVSLPNYLFQCHHAHATTSI